MPGQLVGYFQDKPLEFSGKTLRQLIVFAGDGVLRDGNGTSVEVREMLAAVPLEKLKQFGEECLGESFEGSGFAVQDITNQLGSRLGFQVDAGRYRGVRGEPGHDGLWTANDGHVLVVESKTTDAYRINLDTIAEYRETLIGAGRLTAEKSSILIAVGRQDTGDLEAQIRGSHHAWDIRLISIEALLRLAEIKERLSDWGTSTRINQVLRPFEYTRVDKIVEVLFETSQDIETPELILEPPRQTTTEQTEVKVARSREEAPNLEAAREAGLKRVAVFLGLPLVKKGRALRSTADGSTNIVCMASKAYGDQNDDYINYWCGFTLAQRAFIQESPKGLVVLVCADTGNVYCFDRVIFLPWLGDMLTTPASPASEDEIRHWHVYFNDYGDHVDLMPASGGVKRDILSYRLK